MVAGLRNPPKQVDYGMMVPEGQFLAPTYKRQDTQHIWAALHALTFVRRGPGTMLWDVRSKVHSAGNSN